MLNRAICQALTWNLGLRCGLNPSHKVLYTLWP